MKNPQALFPRINETPRKVSIIGGFRLKTPLNQYDSSVVFIHTYATVKLCKLKEVK